jgi:cytochrome c-type biogenesis protein CcmE
MNRKIILLVVLLVAFGGYAAWSFADSVTPYVGIDQAMQERGTVQVKGLHAENAEPPHMEGKEFVFTLQDEDTGTQLLVRYKGTKPDQFDEAHHVVAIGKYQDGVFRADKLLIKCPSKYEKEKGNV